MSAPRKINRKNFENIELISFFLPRFFVCVFVADDHCEMHYQFPKFSNFLWCLLHVCVSENAWNFNTRQDTRKCLLDALKNHPLPEMWQWRKTLMVFFCLSPSLYKIFQRKQDSSHNKVSIAYILHRMFGTMKCTK